MEATFSHGDPVMIDHTPSGADVSAGDVIVLNDAIFIAHKDIEDGELGALAAGGGVYDLAKTSGSSTAISKGATVYWDDSSNVGTTTASTHKKVGICVAAAGDDDTTVRVLHRPN